jgi:hypothetical protein
VSRPATRRQLRLIAALAEEVGAVAPAAALSVRQASGLIDRLLARRRHEGIADGPSRRDTHAALDAQFDAALERGTRATA